MFTRGYPTLVHSVLQAHSPTWNFLSSLASWCSQHWHRSRPRLDPSTSQIHFYNACTALFSSAVAFVPSLHLPFLLRYMHTVTCCDTHHLFGCPLALYANLCTSWTLYSLLASPFPEHCGSVCLSPCLGRGWHKGKPGGLTSGPSWVTMLLGAAAFCYIFWKWCMQVYDQKHMNMTSHQTCSIYVSMTVPVYEK